MLNNKRLPWILILVCSCVQSVAAQETSLTRAELEAMLKERDAIIISLQHTVNDLVGRLERVERSIQTEKTDQAIEPQPEPETQEVPIAAAPPKEKREGQLEVDEIAAERALERTLVQEGVLLLPNGTAQFEPRLAYSFNEFDFPTAVLLQDSTQLGTSNVERSIFDANLTLRVGLPFDSQLEFDLPYRRVESDIETRVAGSPIAENELSGNGVGDFRIGVAKTLVRERGLRPDIVARLVWNTGSGDKTDNGVILGSGFESLSGLLSFVKRSDPLAFFASLGYQDNFEENGVDPGNQWAFSLGTALAVSPESSLFWSLDNQFISETDINGDRIDGSDLTAVTLNLGISKILRRGTLLNVFTGIGITEDATDYSLGFSVPVLWSLKR
jgi:hypothetical protein